MTMTWGTITDTSPLRVTLDGDTAELPFTPDSLVDPQVLDVNDRVRCDLSGRRVVIVGRSGGDFDPSVQNSIAADVVNLQSREALIRIVPASVAVNAGSASVAADGTITGTGWSTLTINDYAVDDFDRYRVVVDWDSTNIGSDLRLILRNGSTDLGGTVYNMRLYRGGVAGDSSLSQNAAFAIIGRSDGAWGGAVVFEITNPGRTKPKRVVTQSIDANWVVQGGANILSNTIQQSMKLFFASGTVTNARVSVYAYRD